MAGDLSFKAISKDDLDRLQGLADADEVKSVISEVLGHHGPTEREEVEADLVFYVLAFARARGFSDRKTSALISLFHQTLHNDVKARFCRVEASFEAFKTTLMDHAVERPPWSSGVFSAEEVDEIVDFGLRTYFAQHKLYRGALGRTPRLVIKQTRPGLVAEPRPRRALAGAVKIVRRPSGDEGAAGFTADEEAEISAAVSARMSALQQKIES